MIEYIEKVNKNGKKHIIVKFHTTVKNFKRVESLKYQGKFYNLYLDKNNSVYNIERSEVISWKEIVKGKRKIRIPETCETFPEPELLNKIRGNSYEFAIQRLMTEIDKKISKEVFNIS